MAQTLGDVTIEFTDEEPLSVLSLVLSLSSPVFRAMLEGEMQESKTKCIKVDFKRADFEKFYNMLNPATAWNEAHTDESAETVLPLADYYHVTGLKERLMDHLKLENPVNVYYGRSWASPRFPASCCRWAG